MNQVIGLTGGIASGKSTAADYIREKGYPILDADVYARQSTQKDGPAYPGIVEHFGSSIIGEDGEIDRKKLGAIVFNDSREREVLNRLVHPEVRRMMDRDKEKALSVSHVFLDIPLLFENGLDRQCDITLTVYVDQETQIERLMARNDFDRSEALARINSQMPLSEKRERSTEVLDNNGSKADLFSQIDDFLSNLEK
ncbi:dephospho-CoA kinase [Salinicoccus sp. ID82-1]|uniref:Dephospho-CoA kinase n=1 Tax=Salinicoccus cyprini TaxID=2493691 RepID=A0A558AZM8_9STAP|nr:MULTISPECIES: dephospho-CoA kinase [Salinicoccus]MCG1009299.1 dephospho-CoA kinase [Salinicoccus sp. ID82-1]TVT29676.1 dephospho-CoA kinase [Salinicoccus cyprini]